MRIILATALLLLLVTISYSKEKLTKEDSKILSMLGVGGKVIETLSALKTTSSSKFVGRGYGRGLSKLMSNVKVKEGSVARKDLGRLIEIWKRQKFKPKMREYVVSMFDEAVITINNTRDYTMEVDFSEKEGGYMSTLFLQLNEINEKIQYKFATMDADFELAPDYVIIRRKKGNFLMTKEWDEINYIKRGITGEDMKTIIKTCIIGTEVFSLEDRKE